MKKTSRKTTAPIQILFEILKYLFIILVVSTAVGSIFSSILYIYFSKGLPNIITIDDYRPPVVTRVFGKGDVVVGEFFEERRYLVPLEEIPELVIRSFVAAEDDRFFEHHGVDLQGIIRAALANFRAGKVIQGGSTITQQIAKSLLLTPEKSFLRKIKEAILANRMERNLSKKQILYLYLNQIYLGQGAYGVAAAARVYFNKALKELSLSEAALIAGLPQAPSAYSPTNNPKKAKERQQYVLRRLVDGGYISESQMQEAAKQVLRISINNDINEKYAPYYIEHIRKHLIEKFGKEALYQGGLIVKTPIDPALSTKAMRDLQNGLRNIDKRHGYRGPILKTKNLTEMEAATQSVVDYNIFSKHPYRIIQADGTVATDIKTRLGLNYSAYELFDENELYKGIVIFVDDKAKEVQVNLGLVTGVIPLEKMKSAYSIKTNNHVIAKGDIIWVKIISKANNRIVLSLEQIPLLQGALLSMDAISGEVKAMVGGYDFKTSEFNRAIQAERQAGSAFKPIIYAAAIDKGYTPATIIQDSPIVFGTEEKWKPENYEEKFYGDTLFRSALIHSRNIPTIKIAQDIQIHYLMEYAKRLGFQKEFNLDLSMALGSSTTNLLELTQVYSIFPRGGRKIKPIFIHKIIDRMGNLLEENLPTPFKSAQTKEVEAPPSPVRVAGQLQAELASGNGPERGVWVDDLNDPDRVMDSRTAYVLTHLMNEVATMGTGHEAKNLGRPAAGKTGTTNDYQDAWFVGFIPQLVTGVWVGFDAQKSIGSKAAAAAVALPIWLEFMKEAVKPYSVENFGIPTGITFSYIHTRTGKPSAANRPYSVREAFVKGTEPNNDSAVSESNAPDSNSGDSSDDSFFKEDIQ